MEYYTISPMCTYDFYCIPYFAGQAEVKFTT